MLKTNFSIDGKRVKEPLNYKNLSIELNFDKDDPNFRGQVSINEWSIGLGDQGDIEDGAKIIKDYINGGLIGGLGVFEGLPFKIELENNGVSQDLFNGYLDLSEAEVLCDRVTAKALETGGVDWFNEVANSLKFEYLALTVAEGGAGTITEADYVLMPYVLSTIPNTQELFTLTISAFVITQELIRTFQEWQEWSIAFTGDWLEFGNLLTLILLTVKNILLIIAIIKLIDQIIKAIIQPIKYQAGMFLNDLCVKGAEHLGYSFESTILDKYPFNSVLMIPESYNHDEEVVGTRKIKDIWADFTLGVSDVRDSDRTGYYNGTFGELLRELKTMFNAKIFIDNGVLRLERIDYNPSINNFQLPNIDRSNIPVRFNFEDLKSLYSVTFTDDSNDKNIWQSYLGTELNVYTNPKAIRNTQNVLNKGEDVRKFGFARGKRKDSLNFIERYIDEFITDVDRIVGVVQNVIKGSINIIKTLLKPVKKLITNLNKIPGVSIPAFGAAFVNAPFDWNLRSNFNPRARIGALLLENDYINVPKLVMITAQNADTEQRYIKVSPQNSDIINALYLYNNYHFINSFVGTSSNQYKIYTIENIPFCIDDYNKVKKSNVVKEFDGREGLIVSLKWNVYRQVADITYKVREKYTDNLQETKALNDGK